ncbi:diguanylate cyclase (GGDEF) domain-containing protein [Aureimonas phyllosphaerae]|nr:diguanylate cyclase (GGDEF) domain-containing protein [Aureimonas phyllosphaerae]
MSLSIPTLQFTDSVVFLTCGVVFVSCWLLHRERLHHLLFGLSFLLCASMSIGFVDFGRYGSVWSPLGWSTAGMLFWVGLRLFDQRSAMTTFMMVMAVVPVATHVLLDLATFDEEAVNTGSTIAYAIHEAAMAVYVLSMSRGRSPIRKVIGLSLLAISIALCLPLLSPAILPPNVPVILIFVVDHVSSILLTTAILALEADRANLALARQALRDPLTQVLNRAGLVAQTQHVTGPAGVVVVDLDHFKRVNDGHGHTAGDHVLGTFARRAELLLPFGAHIARFGGEEFVLVLPGAGRAETAVFAERLRRSIGAQPIDWNGAQIEISVSVGVAIALGGPDIPAAVDRADKALYVAKTNGRNQVRVA